MLGDGGAQGLGGYVGHVSRAHLAVTFHKRLDGVFLRNWLVLVRVFGLAAHKSFVAFNDFAFAANGARLTSVSPWPHECDGS